MDFIFPFASSIDFFLGIFACLPLPFFAFILFSAGLFAIGSILRLVLYQ